MNTNSTDMITRFGTVENFKKTIEKNGYMCLEPDDLSWGFIKAFFEGKKKLIKFADVPANFQLPPRFTKQVKRIDR